MRYYHTQGGDHKAYGSDIRMRDTARDRIARRQHGQDPLLPVTDVSIPGTQLCLDRFSIITMMPW